MDAYKETFDVVIVDDHSIEIVDLLLMKILHLWTVNPQKIQPGPTNICPQ